MSERPLPLLFLVGPTAAGKKRAALFVAQKLPVELLSLDSMKVYRGMDLGTDKLAQAGFGLTDLAEPSERFSVGAWVRAAEAAVAAARVRGRVPLFVGGTGLYLRALVRGLATMPDVPPAARERTQALLDERGAPAVHAELARVDSESAARLHANDRKRIARAYEVWLATGRTLSSWQADSTRRPIAGEPTLVGIRFGRTALRARVAARVERMFAAGLVDEVRRLLQGGRVGPVAGLAIGYREIAGRLREGRDDDASLAECRLEIVQHTMAFVRRQENWLRQFPEITWIDGEGGSAQDPDFVPRRVAELFNETLGEILGARQSKRGSSQS